MKKGTKKTKTKTNQKVVRDFSPSECLKTKEKLLYLDVNMSLVKL